MSNDPVGVMVSDAQTRFSKNYSQVAILAGGALSLAGSTLYGILSGGIWPAAAHFLAYVGAGAIAGGGASWLTNYFRVRGIVQHEVTTAIYSPEHLRQRADREQLWENATRALHDEGFNDLGPKIYRRILKDCIPIDRKFYLQGARRRITLKLVDRTRRIVQVKAHFDAKLITVSSNQPIVRSASLSEVISVPGHESPKMTMRFLCPRTNKPLNVPTTSTTSDDGHDHRIDATLEPNRQYIVHDESIYYQPLDDDNWNLWQAVTHVDGMRWEVRFEPQDILVQFKPVGGVQFVQDGHETDDLICQETSDLIFAGGGYILSMQVAPSGALPTRTGT